MEEKKPIKISLSTFFLILSIIVIIIMAYFIYKLNNEKTAETEKVEDLNAQVSSLQSTVNNLNEKINDVSNTVNNSNSENTASTTNPANNNNSNTINNTNSTKYIEMIEENYKKYNTSPYSFRIQEMIDNNNGTITIKGRVYQKTDLPKITKEQYNSLLNGKTINLLGYQMEISNDEAPDNSGYDMLITSTDNPIMKFYVEKNSDGSGKLHNYTETERYIGTDTYMQITLDENLKCEFGDTSSTLRENYNSRKANGMLSINMNDDIIEPSSNDEFHFQDGKCTSIAFSNV